MNGTINHPQEGILFWLGQATYRRDSAIGSGTYGISEYLLDIYGNCVVIRHYANKEKVRLEIEEYTPISRESKINAY
jgi:hypothetical protein